MDVGVQCRAEALDGGDRRAAPVRDAAAACTPALEPEHRPYEHRQYGAAEPVVPREA